MTPPAPSRTAPTISVIVPVYNVAAHVGACIASLRSQSFTDFEVIAVDDGSTDDSAARLAEAIGDDPRFFVITQANGGLSAARNTGLEAARGAFIAFVDSDDRVAPEFLAHLHGALTATDADWAACAIRFCYPDGSGTVHSGIHGQPELEDAPTLWPLTDWREAIRHFPSAWNKLYRRRLIGDLRFTEGLYFEDHVFFQELAARSDHLLHVPEPLYLQTRQRPGQITGEDSDRVFEQFPVLEQSAAILTGTPGRTHGREAFGRLASRLAFERSTALRDPARRARFATAAAAFLDRHGLRYDTAWDRDLSPAWGREMAGDLPLSVVIPWDGQDHPLLDTLAALAAPPAIGAEIVLVCDPGCLRATPARAEVLADRVPGLPPLRVLTAPAPGPGMARNAGLAQAHGLYVLFLDAGDRPLPYTLLRWCDAMERENADFGTSQFRMGTGATGAWHGGFHDMAQAEGLPETAFAFTPEHALALHCMPSAKIFRRSFLTRTGLAFGPGPLSDWPMGIGAALTSQRSLYFSWPGVEISEAPDCRRLWTAPVPARRLTRAVADLPRALPPAAAAALPDGWQARLLVRAFWEKLQFAGLTGAARHRFRLGAARALIACPRPPAGTPADPYIGHSRLLRLAGLRHSD